MFFFFLNVLVLFLDGFWMFRDALIRPEIFFEHFWYFLGRFGKLNIQKGTQQITVENS